MPTPVARRAQLAADTAELRALLQTARADRKALPAPAQRNAAQRDQARRNRLEQLVARVLLNITGTPTDDDLVD